MAYGPAELVYEGVAAGDLLQFGELMTEYGELFTRPTPPSRRNAAGGNVAGVVSGQLAMGSGSVTVSGVVVTGHPP